MSDCHDGSRRLNLKVLRGLRAGDIVLDDRRTGKSITLLTYIAAGFELSLPRRPIVVCERLEGCRHLQFLWRNSFLDMPEPRWMSYRVYLSADGTSGPVFVDEPRDYWCIDRIRYRAHGEFAGGVTSFLY